MLGRFSYGRCHGYNHAICQGNAIYFTVQVPLSRLILSGPVQPRVATRERRQSAGIHGNLTDYNITTAQEPLEAFGHAYVATKLTAGI